MDELIQGAKTLGITLSDTQISSFKDYLNEIQAWNEHTNITAIRDPKDIVIKHFLDSLTLIPYLPKDPFKLIDIGSGAGLPGIPLKIMRPDASVTLVESVGKKASFLEHVISTLKLSYCTVHNARAEELGHEILQRGHYDIAVGRAVAELSVLVEYTLPFLKLGGSLISQKTPDDEELNNAAEAIKTLGGNTPEIHTVTIPELSDHKILIIQKIHPTPNDFPRRTGIPSKKPL